MLVQRDIKEKDLQYLNSVSETLKKMHEGAMTDPNINGSMKDKIVVPAICRQAQNNYDKWLNLYKHYNDDTLHITSQSVDSKKVGDQSLTHIPASELFLKDHVTDQKLNLLFTEKIDIERLKAPEGTLRIAEEAKVRLFDQNYNRLGELDNLKSSYFKKNILDNAINLATRTFLDKASIGTTIPLEKDIAAIEGNLKKILGLGPQRQIASDN